ncbi:MAG: hypothetical protein HQL66_08045 [Magnetococcales bacterium]|nr:hypothetical protein [Magnetococcales bacterium]
MDSQSPLGARPEAENSRGELLVPGQNSTNLEALKRMGLGELEDIVKDVNVFDRNKINKEKLKFYLEVRSTQFREALSLFNDATVAARVVNRNAIGLRVRQANEELQKLFQEFQQREVLVGQEKLFDLMEMFGKMVTRKLNELDGESEVVLREEMRQRIAVFIKERWDKIQGELEKGIDSYFDELLTKEEKKGHP